MSIDFWAQVAPGIAINIFAALILWVVRRGVKKIVGTIATKEFVTATLALHEENMMEKMDETFLKTSQQLSTNNAVDSRLGRLEEAVRRIEQALTSRGTHLANVEITGHAEISEHSERREPLKP